MKVKGSTFFLSTLLICGLAVGFAQQLDVDRELEEAKALYREAKFAQAIAKLQATIGRLEQLRDIQARKIQLSDAHLHLALSYVALNDPSAAKESLKQMLRVDRNRKLDPDVYAPKVIELFEEAKTEVAKEPATAAAPVPTSSPQAAAAKKGGSKAPLILLGAAAAAGGGIAVAKGGGGTTGATSAATPTPTPTTTPTPTVSGSQDIALISTAPPPGSTVSLSSGRFPLVATLSVVNNATANYCVQLVTEHPGEGPDFGNACLNNSVGPISMVAGQAQTVTVPIEFNARRSCTVPFTVSGLTACVTTGEACFPSRTLFCRHNFPVTYTFVR